MKIMKIVLGSSEINLPILPGDVSDTIWSALRNGTYEAKEAYWVRKAVRTGDRVLELGTGLGIIATILATEIDVQVSAFDANPEIVRLAENVVKANGRHNISVAQGLMTAGSPRDFLFYLRKDFWMSSVFEDQGPYERIITIRSIDIDEFIVNARITLLIMDIEGGECELLQGAELPGVERVFLELHDHLYGLAGVRQITTAMAAKGFAYDPRGSSGACVLFSRNLDIREYEEEAYAVSA
ncbi:FkbM family methyltransferase [Phyllobacterium zundukense]|nr:FkbM family methyltransferase [Phyllobacterium zundukense]